MANHGRPILRVFTEVQSTEMCASNLNLPSSPFRNNPSHKDNNPFRLAPIPARPPADSPFHFTSRPSPTPSARSPVTAGTRKLAIPHAGDLRLVASIAKLTGEDRKRRGTPSFPSDMS